MVNLVQMCKKIYTVLLVISPTAQSIAVQNELVLRSSFLCILGYLGYRIKSFNIRFGALNEPTYSAF